MAFFLPDPGELRALAGRIDASARAARARADRLGGHVAGLDWQGLAAGAFAGQAQLVLGGLRSAAGRLDDAADALRRHADHVDGVFTAIVGLVRAGVDEAVTVGTAVASTVGDLAGDALDLVGW